MHKILILLFSLVYAIDGSSQSWKQDYDSAEIYWTNDWNKTVKFLKIAESKAAQDIGIYDENYLTIINDLGVAYWRSKDLVNAEKTLTRRIKIVSEIPGDYNTEDFFSGLYNLAGVYNDLGNSNKSRSVYNRILRTHRSASDSLIFAIAQNLMQSYEQSFEVDSSFYIWTEFENKHHFTKVVNKPMGKQWTLDGARINRKTHRYAAASELVLKAAADLGDGTGKEISSLYIQCITEQGLIDLATGLYSQAERELLKAMRLAKLHYPNQPLLIGEIQNNLAQAYEKLNMLDNAIVYYKEALKAYRLNYGEDTFPVLSLKNNIAGVYLRQGKLEEAKKEFEEVYVRYQKILPENDIHFLTTLSNLATTHQRLNQFDKALVLFSRALSIIKKHDMEQQDVSASVKNNVAALYSIQGNFKDAVTYFNEALTIKEKLYGKNNTVLKDILGNIAMVYWTLDNKDKAVEMFNRNIALNIREIKFIFPHLSQDGQTQYYQQLKDDFERFNTVAVALQAEYPQLLTQMVEHQMLIKSIKFLTDKKRRLLIEQSKDSVLMRQFLQLSTKREQLGHYYQLPLTEGTQVNVTIQNLESDIESLEKIVSTKTGDALSTDMIATQASWKEIFNSLKPGEAFVEMIRFRKFSHKASLNEMKSIDRGVFGFTDSIFYAAAVTRPEWPEGPRIVVMKNGKHMETRLLKYYKNSIRFEFVDKLSYAVYWKPFEKLLSGSTTIYLSNDGVYHKINANTLLNTTKGRYLLQENNIHLILNASQLLNDNKINSVGKDAVLMGDPNFEAALPNEAKTRKGEIPFSPLPGTHTEIIMIDKALRKQQWQTMVLLKQTASEQNLKKLFSPTVLHIASHGFFSNEIVKLNDKAKNDFLFHSGLVLSGANNNVSNITEAFSNDGILTAYEVMNLNLSRTDLVVLSACETGLGKIESGEGVFGLQRSFLQAGAKNVLISLWKVDDGFTRDLMISFYDKLSSGQNKREALKAAQLELLTKTNNPLLWGAFVMIGMD